jgi:hypothetical protein
MQFTAQLDVDVVALEAEDEVTCLVSLTAPVPEEIADRPGETLIAVVDRSGSMQGGPIEAVRTEAIAVKRGHWAKIGRRLVRHHRYQLGGEL